MENKDYMDVVEDVTLIKLDSKMLETLGLGGVFTLTHKDKNGKILSVTKHRNLITNEGKDYILDAALHGATNVADWYFAIFTSGSAAAGNTYATPNRTEATTTVNESTRPAWGEGASSGQSVTNASAATVTANGSLAVTGIGVVGSPSADGDADTKGDTACADCVLLSDVDVSKTLATTETLDITYAINA